VAAEAALQTVKKGFTVIESLVAMGLVAVLAVMAATAGWRVYEDSSLAISANNIRQLTVGAQAYLADHNFVFWPYLATNAAKDSIWWFGLETLQSTKLPEGQRKFDPAQGPLGGYVPAALRPDPSLKLGGKAFKPKYQSGYLGVGYNVLLGGGWLATTNAAGMSFWKLSEPGKVVVFCTSAQVNNFQPPASAKNPMIEEFYGIDTNQVTVHFRHHGMAMVGFASGSAGFLPMDESTRDQRAPQANIGRFAPVGDNKYLE